MCAFHISQCKVGGTLIAEKQGSKTVEIHIYMYEIRSRRVCAFIRLFARLQNIPISIANGLNRSKNPPTLYHKPRTLNEIVCWLLINRSKYNDKNFLVCFMGYRRVPTQKWKNPSRLYKYYRVSNLKIQPQPILPVRSDKTIVKYYIGRTVFWALSEIVPPGVNFIYLMRFLKSIMIMKETSLVEPRIPSYFNNTRYFREIGISVNSSILQRLP